jgi:hypothetical protein
MRIRALALSAIGVSLLSLPPAAAAQPGSPNTTPGEVVRVTLVRIVPGHADAFWQDMRQHLKPIYEEYKKRGIITGYTVATKSTTEDPNDWNVVVTLSYPNWAAFDNLGQRTDPVTLAHYGTAAQRTAAGQARIQHGTIISSFLIRAQAVNDWR